jgi:hypothetical protein
MKFTERVKVWFKLAGHYFVEICLAVSGFLGILGKFTTLGIQSSLAITIFLCSIIYSIFRIRESIEKIDELSASVNSLLLEHSPNFPEQYLRLVFKGVEESREPHIRAGHDLATEVYKYAGALVSELRKHHESKDRVQIVERFVINDFLKGVVNSLPKESYWLGITQLTSAWASEPDPGFRDLADAMNGRAAKGELSVLRIYCVESSHSFSSLEPHLREAAKSGIKIRIWSKPERMPPDLSLVWGPLDTKGLDLSIKPADALSQRAPAICGMEFETRQGRSLDTLMIWSPTSNSNEYRRLKFAFDDAWSEAKPYQT